MVDPKRPATLGESAGSRAEVQRDDAHRPIERLVFVVGCPRSGTTWLQLLLFQHPEVAGGQETHVFSNYLRSLDRRWQREAGDPSPRKVGLPVNLTRSQFDRLLRDFAAGVFGSLASTKPGATVLVEKTPNHIYDWELILRLFPDAWFVHVIRDPRSVVCSLRHARQSWGARWAPEGVIEAAGEWVRAVEHGRQIADATDKCKEVFYEDLESRGAETLLDILQWLGLDADRPFVEEALAACRIENLRGGSSVTSVPWRLGEEPENFYRKGGSQGWQDELSTRQVRLVEHVTDALMARLPYTRVTPRGGAIPLGLLRRHVVRAVLRRLASVPVLVRLLAWARRNASA